MKKNKLYGAILGDLAGQPYEFPPMKYFPSPSEINLHNPESKFTDDTLMTLATAKALMDKQSFEEAYKEVGNKYQGDHYGKGFKEWLTTPIGTTGTSWGNGCLMRISPIMYLNIRHFEKQKLIIESCVTSHCNGMSIIYSLELLELYNSHQNFTETPLKHFEKFEVKADKTFEFCKHLVSKYSDWDSTLHEAIRMSISCGGDTDTNASIIGEFMNYKNNHQLTQDDIQYVESKLDPYLLNILHRFNKFV